MNGQDAIIQQTQVIGLASIRHSEAMWLPLFNAPVQPELWYVVRYKREKSLMRQTRNNHFRSLEVAELKISNPNDYKSNYKVSVKSNTRTLYAPNTPTTNIKRIG